jgi:hypothetical protein
VGEDLAFRIGRSERAHLIVRPRRRRFPEATNYEDANWLEADVEIAAGAFSGSFVAELRTDELAYLRERLSALYENLLGRVRFEPTEPWLRMEIRGDGRGHFEAICRADDCPGIGNRLEFRLEFDQTELPGMLRDLDAVCAAFPVVGSRG